MSKSDRDYYLARITAEREAAEAATNDAARRAHLQLVEKYEQRLSDRLPAKSPGAED